MSFPSNDEAGPLTAIETTGTYWLLKDKKGFAWLGVNGRKSAYPIFSDYEFLQRKVNSGNWKLVGVEVKQGVRKIAEQHKTDNRLRITTIDRQYISKSKSTIYKVNTTGFDNQEEFFGMNFPGDNESAKINYWAPNRFFSSLWGFKNNASGGGGNVVNAFKQFDTPDQGVKIGSGQNLVAVIDSGIRRTHEDLYQNMWVNKNEIYGNGVDDDGNGYIDDRNGIAFFDSNGINYYNTSDAYLNDSVGHGTHVAGTIGAATNKVGVIGTNPSAKIMNININTPGQGIPSLNGVIFGVAYAGNNGAKVINMSLSLGYSEALEDMMKAVSDTYKPLFIVSAGNAERNNDNTATYPATFDLDSIISVAASNDQGQRASFSNYGQKTVDLYAPGDKILSTLPDSNSSYGYKSGTSMAAPFVAGAVSAYWARNKGLTNIQVKNHLLNTTTKKDAYADTVSGGIININNMYSTQRSSSDQVDSKENTGNDPNRKAVKRWEKLYEIEASELSGFKSKKITTTLFGHLSDEWQKAYKRNFIERESLNDNGIFKHIENVNTFENLNPGFIVFNIDKSHGLGKKKILSKLFNKGIFTSIEVDRKLPKFDSALPADQPVETITFENILSDGLRNDTLTGGLYDYALSRQRNDHIYGDWMNDTLIGRSNKYPMIRNVDLNYDRMQQANNHSIRRFNDNENDQLMFATIEPGVSLPSSGNGILPNNREDLMSVLEEPLGEVQRNSDFLL